MTSIPIIAVSHNCQIINSLYLHLNYIQNLYFRENLISRKTNPTANQL